MKTAFITTVLAVLLVAASPCLALWSIATVSREQAKKMGMDVRSKPAGPDNVMVELEFKLDGQLKDFTGVELRTGGKENPPGTPMLTEDRSKPGRVIVSFTADRAALGKLSLGVRVQELDGGSIYELRMKDFVELKDEKKGEEKQAPPKQQAAKSDQERMIGNWHITNDDSMRKGEMWVIDEDRILMYAKHGGANANLYLHRLDASKDPRQIDITVTLVKGTPVGIIKGIYALDGDELRLCLAALDKDRPAAFPKKPGPGEVLVLQRAKQVAEPPKAKEVQPDAK